MVLVVLVFIWPPSTGRPVRLNDQLNDGSKKNEMKWNVNENEQQNKPIHLRENFFFKFISYLTNMWMREIKIVAREWRKKMRKGNWYFVSQSPKYHTTIQIQTKQKTFFHTHTKWASFFFEVLKEFVYFPCTYLASMPLLCVCVCV